MEKCKLIIVDDEEDFILTFAERLKIRGVNSRIATSGEKALDFIKEEIPDVVLTDLKMPGMDGLELLESIKKPYPEVQVIILTGHGSGKEEAEAIRLGAFHYIRKPVDINELVQILKEAYQERSMI